MGRSVHRAISSSAHPSALARPFNARALDVNELESKFLVKKADRAVFDKIKSYFEAKGWVQYHTDDYHLLTRQLDTVDRRLLQDGFTLRIRGNCKDRDINNINRSDICAKTDKRELPNGALLRGEYEARTNSFEQITLSALLKKYPREDYPEIHDVLKGVKAKDLMEHFRIDVYRTRYVLELPREETGSGKRFVCEVDMDDVAFVLDIPGLKQPLLFHHDLEVECEALLKPCEYDLHAGAKACPPMSVAELEQAMTVLKQHLVKAGGGQLKENHLGKGERGFRALDRVESVLLQYLSPNTACEPRDRPSALRTAFVLNAANDNRGAQVDLSGVLPYLRRALRNHDIALRQ